MHLIDENYQRIETFENNKEKLFWTFDSGQCDFFLKSCMYWQSVTSDSYTLQVGNGSITLPYNYYMVIGDYDSGFDCVTPEEIMGREFDAFTFSNDLVEGSHGLEPVQITHYENDVNFILPFIKTVFPVMTSDSRAMFIVNKDSYNKFKEIPISEIL